MEIMTQVTPDQLAQLPIKKKPLGFPKGFPTAAPKLDFSNQFWNNGIQITH